VRTKQTPSKRCGHCRAVPRKRQREAGEKAGRTAVSQAVCQTHAVQFTLTSAKEGGLLFFLFV
jgi:hypothetical protein